MNDLGASVDFYTKILGLASEDRQDPFAVIRVTADLIMLLAPWGTEGNQHLAFSMTAGEFQATFDRVRAAGIDYGDTFHEVGNMKGPGKERGARGMGWSLYFLDPSRHLIEIRSYENL